MKKRHKIFWAILRPLVALFLRIKFGYRYEPARDLPENYIVLSNHVTDFDPLFVGVSFRRQMYFVASEHISRWPRAYKLIEYALQPIVRYKGSTAASTVMEMLRTARAGGNVCMFAEGARCWDGVTSVIQPATGKVVKNARCGLVTYKIVGGYFVSPNWSQDGTRRGPVRGSVVRVYTPEELAAMSVDEINAAINRDLHEDAYERQLAEPRRYRSRQPARRMENMLYLCPTCGAMETLSSHGDTVTCSACGHSFRYTEYGMLEGLPQTTVKELFAWLLDRTRAHAEAGAVYAAPEATLRTVSKQAETPVDAGALALDRTHLSCGGTAIALEDITSMAMHGRRALVFSTRDKYYELIVPTACALKFLLLFQLYRFGEIRSYN